MTSQEPVTAPVPPERDATRLDLVAELPAEHFASLVRFVKGATKIERTCDEYGPVVRVYARAA